MCRVGVASWVCLLFLLSCSDGRGLSKWVDNLCNTDSAVALEAANSLNSIKQLRFSSSVGRSQVDRLSVILAVTLKVRAIPGASSMATHRLLSESSVLDHRKYLANKEIPTELLVCLARKVREPVLELMVVSLVVLQGFLDQGRPEGAREDFYQLFHEWIKSVKCYIKIISNPSE